MNIYKELQNKKRYREFFDRLAKKLHSEPHRRNQKPAGSEITPTWMLLNESEISSTAIKEVKKKTYLPGPAQVKTIRVDKERKIFSLTWPDRMMDSVLSSILTEAIEPTLSDRLFSFRKGRSNYKVISEFGAYISNLEQKGIPVYIIKQDVSDYGDSINREILLKKLSDALGHQDPYIARLVNAFAHPTKHLGEDDVLKNVGIPMGLSITPVSENLYLSELDKEIDKIEGVFYSRFGDDIMLASDDVQKVLKADRLIASYLTKHGLIVKPEKRQQLCLAKQSYTSSTDFPTKPAIEYLGFSISFLGEIFLSKEKETNLKRDFRMTAKKSALANRKLGKELCLKKVILAVSLHLEKELMHPYLEAALSIVNDAKALKSLDTWIAKVCLRYIYGTGHDRVFKYKSLKQLRKMGVPSILHLKNSTRRKRFRAQ
ncbi:MAG: reverse transcriptase domain-containing protein [Bdellovibrionota bacterium]